MGPSFHTLSLDAPERPAPTGTDTLGPDRQNGPGGGRQRRLGGQGQGAGGEGCSCRFCPSEHLGPCKGRKKKEFLQFQLTVDITLC